MAENARPVDFLIHQVGKVASQSVEQALRQAAGDQARIERLHYISDAGLALLDAAVNLPGGGDAVDSVRHQASLARQVCADFRSADSRDAWVLTGWRDPLDQVVSAVFQNLPSYFPWISMEPADAAAMTARIADEIERGVGRLRDGAGPASFAEALLELKLRGPGWWFDTEFLPLHGLTRDDLLAGAGQDFHAFAGDGRRFLLWRTAALRDGMDLLLGHIGLKTASPIAPINDGAAKDYGPLYAEFRKAYDPSAMVREWYAADWSRALAG